MIKNTLPDNLKILKVSKNNRKNSEAFSTHVPIAAEDLLRAFYRLFYLQFFDSSDQ